MTMTMTMVPEASSIPLLRDTSVVVPNFEILLTGGMSVVRVITLSGAFGLVKITETTTKSTGSARAACVDASHVQKLRGGLVRK